MQRKTPTVVVIDNRPAVKTLFERSTENLDVELLIFTSAADSRAYLETNKPDLLILNIILPDKDGLILLKELRKFPLHKDTSVVMVSSKDYAQDRIMATELGALDFIPVPVPIKTIEDVVVKITKAKPSTE